MNDIEILKQEIHELKRNQELILKFVSPKEYSVSTVAKITGRTRQAVRDWMIKHGEPEVDFYKKGANIMLSEKVALTYINKRR